MNNQDLFVQSTKQQKRSIYLQKRSAALQSYSLAQTEEQRKDALRQYSHILNEQIKAGL